MDKRCWASCVALPLPLHWIVAEISGLISGDCTRGLPCQLHNAAHSAFAVAPCEAGQVEVVVSPVRAGYALDCAMT